MPRIRTIKPEFWQDEKLSPLAPIDRLVFLGLISLADDAGRLLDNVKAVDGFIFSDTDDSARDSLETLARLSRIVRYTSESGQRLIQIVNWKHQKVDKPSKHVLPGPPNREAPGPQQDTPAVASEARASRETVEESSRSDLVPSTNDLVPVPSIVDPREGSTASRTRVVPELDHRLTADLRCAEPIREFLGSEQVEGSLLAWARTFAGNLGGLGTHQGKAATPEQIAVTCSELRMQEGKVTPNRYAKSLAVVMTRAEPNSREPPKRAPPAKPVDPRAEKYVTALNRALDDTS